MGLYFTYALTYGGAVLALIDPFIGLLVYVIFAILRPDDLWFWCVPHGNYSRIVAIAMLLGWVLRGFGDWRVGQARGIVMCLLFFWIWTLLSYSFAGDAFEKNVEVTAMYVDRLTKIVVPFIVGVTVINSVWRARVLAWVILLCHGYLAFEMNLNYLSGRNLVWEQGFSFMDNNGVAIAMDTLIGFAFFLGLAATYWWQKLIALMSAILMLHVVLFSFSRGGMLGLLVTGAVAFVLIPKKTFHYLIFAGMILAGIVLAGPEVRERFMSSFDSETNRDSSAQERLELWKACLDVMKNKPFFGCGPGHWQVTSSSYGFPEGKAAHSTWFQAGAELGVPALVALLLFYFLTARLLWPYARDRAGESDPWFRDSARMVIASVVGFCVSSQFVTLSLLEQPYYVVLVGVVTLTLSSRNREEAARQAHWAMMAGTRIDVSGPSG
jgi:probable O-glycosylation ligase (exosortase A-associated)